MTILIADDDRGLVLLLSKHFLKKGFEVMGAYDALQASHTAMRRTIDAVILDLSMPDMDGIEVVRSIRRELPEIKVVVVSGFMEGVMLEVAGFLGADATLAKPANAQALLKTVCDVLCNSLRREATSD